jgi:uridylate kinase
MSSSGIVAGFFVFFIASSPTDGEKLAGARHHREYRIVMIFGGGVGLPGTDTRTVALF